MSSSLEYTRKFVILKRDYGTVEKGMVKGHCKVEKRGPRNIFSVSIENAEIEDFYNIILVSKDEAKSTWQLGKIFTDDMGKGKDEYSFTQRDLEGSGFPANKISAILLVKDNEIVLAGYIDKEDGSIEDYISDFLGREDAKYEGEGQELEIVEEGTEEHADLPMEVALPDPVEEPDGEEAGEEMKPPVEMIAEDEDYEDQVVDSDEGNAVQEGGIDQGAQTVNYVLSILRFFPYIVPFKNNLRGYNWWLIDLDMENEYKSFLPYFSHVLGGNKEEYYDKQITTCNQLVNKYQHYLFGLYNEEEKVKYFLYGIPGTFTRGEHPNGGISGFNTWMEGENVEGYWIIYIDPLTGESLEIPNPMIPID
ncbi:MAG: hypothetical protein WCZ27_08605 [Tissierellaceae bacterium]|nr:hypothetical protein [Tissierellaceae bacterium]